MKKEVENRSIPLQGPTKFRLQNTWNPVEDLKEKERNQLLKEISSSLKNIEKTLERIEDLFRFKLFDTEINASE
ncbi:MAG TPA: hypothetical protein GX502_04185 [Syntrophaceticus sp.]|nr:hypothetical protein [Syntrophaceticus sp.]